MSSKYLTLLINSDQRLDKENNNNPTSFICFIPLSVTEATGHIWL